MPLATSQEKSDDPSAYRRVALAIPLGKLPESILACAQHPWHASDCRIAFAARRSLLMPGKSWIWLVAALVLGAVPSSFPASLSPRHNIKVWTTDLGGLPQNSVIAIAQTRDGYLWLGTINGLARFDGVHFRVYDESNTPEFDGSAIVKLFEDSQGRLWVAAESGRIIIVQKDGSITRTSVDYPAPETSAGRVASFVETTDGQIWLYTADGRLARHQDNRMDIWSSGAAFPSRTRVLFADKSGFLWIGTDYTLSAFGPTPLTGTQLPSAFELRAGKIDFALPSKQGGHWLLANGHIQKWSTNHMDHDFGSYPWPAGLMVSAACEDGTGNLFVGTYGDPGDGVYCIPLEGKPWHLQGLSHPSILSLSMDREGSLWVGSDGGGLHRVRSQFFGVVDFSEGSTVQSVSEDPDGGLWIAYNGDRLDYWKGNVQQQFTNLLGSLSLQQEIAARSVLVDRAGSIWVGLQTRPGQRAAIPFPLNESVAPGLLKLNDQHLMPVPGFEVANQQVSAIFQDNRGWIWVGTKGGAASFDGESWRTNGLSGNAVQAIAQDSAGRIWLGTDRGGLNCLQEGRVTIYTKTNGLPSDSILSLLADRSGLMWVGTAAGLARFDGTRWTTYTTKEGLAGNNIAYLIEDRQDQLWLGSSAGLMRIAKSALNDYAASPSNSLSIRVFGKQDGLPTGECSQGSQPAGCLSSNGMLWIPTIKGLAAVDPSHIEKNPFPPPVILESVLVDNRIQNNPGLRAPTLSELVIPAGKESLDLRYTVLSLSAPDQAKFRFRLENHETGWTEGTGSGASPHYTKLPPKRYLFRIQACNEDEVWNEIGASLAITVLPPFWQTWWFLTVVTLFLLAVIVSSVHFVSTQKLQRQLALLRQQEAVEKERARIARDLHDQLGANLTQVALLGEMAENDKELPDEVEAHAQQIAATARDTTRALDEIVWTVNPANDTLDGLINYICKYAQEFLALADLRYRIEVPPQLPAVPISPELRHNAFLAAKEAINNVVKHSGASSAWLRLHLEPARFILEIADDGKGLPSDAANKGRNGLRNMRKRMEEVGGDFSIGPATEGGTLVRLTAPFSPLPATESAA